jgi:starch synthase
MPGRSVCFVSSEVAPFAKTGGLADVSGALPKYLSAEGCDVRVFMPFYSSIDVSQHDFHIVDFLKDVVLRFGSEELTFTVLTAKLPGSDVDLYFIDCPRLYNRRSVYTDDPDEYLRFALLCRATLECCQRMGWGPEIIHCNDWQTGLIPLYLKKLYGWDRLFARTRTVLTIHNIGYQGVFSSRILPTLGLEEHYGMLDAEDLHTGVINFLKTGLFYADLLTTVSITYAREIQMSEYGAGLDWLLRMRSGSLVGIVNGVDYNEWSPETDGLIPYNYSVADLAGKRADKLSLLQHLEMRQDLDAPLFGIVSRLTSQKGFDLFFDILRDFLHGNNAQLAILGSGDEKYERFFSAIEGEFRGRVCFYRGFNNRLAHMIEAGSDIFLMPSQYEPCGLNQIYSLRYGTIPVVRKTGGLADTVINYDASAREGTGFVFEHFTSDGLRWAMNAAVATYWSREEWGGLMRRAMARNYSWDLQVKEYLRCYEALLD